MARGAALVSLDSYNLTGVQVTDRKIGSGSAAVVIELEYMGHKCAGKKIHDILLKHGGDDHRDAIRNFSKECHFLSKIQHPNIVQFLGVCFQEPEKTIPVMVMEFLPINLASCIKNHRGFPKEICYSLLLDIAQGLLYLHDRQSPVIHRDLSSNNILLSPVLTAKIADLGVARIVNISPLQVSTLTGNPGTLIYMPPEVLVDSPRYNTGIDIFSYGVLMIEVLCGRSPRPHVGPNRSESGELVAVSEAERRLKYLHMVGNDHPLMNLICKCIHNDAKERPSAKQVVRKLQKDQTDSKVAIPSFKEKVGILKFVAEKEAKKGKEKQNLELKHLSFMPKQKKTLSYSTFCMWTTIIALLFFIVFNSFISEELSPWQNSTGNVYRPCDSYIKFLLAKQKELVKATFSECDINEKIVCDEFIPTFIHSVVKNISWSSGEPLVTTLHQGQSVLIGDKMYYGGGFASDEVHKYYVYCYDTVLGNWTTIQSLPVKSFGLGKFDGKLIALGGITMEGEESKKVYTYDTKTNSWVSDIHDMPITRVFPGILSLPSALIIAGGENSISVYTKETGWYWSNQPLTVSCSDVALVTAGNRCFLLAGNYTKELMQSDWFPLSMYISLNDLLYDRNKTVPGRAYEDRNELIYPSYRWKQLPGGFDTQANSLVGTVLAGNLVILGKRSQPWNSELKMFSFMQESWTRIGQLPDDLQIGTATIAALSSTELLVTGKKEDGLLSVYIGSVYEIVLP